MLFKNISWKVLLLVFCGVVIASAAAAWFTKGNITKQDPAFQPPAIPTAVGNGSSLPLPPPPPPSVPGTKTAAPALAKTRIKEGAYYVTVVNVSDAGFSPTNFIVYPGEIVRFVNKDQQSMRMIADTTGGLTPYPGFDQIKSVGKGGTYQFTLSQTGAWGFVNQFNPTKHLLITVTK